MTESKTENIAAVGLAVQADSRYVRAGELAEEADPIRKVVPKFMKSSNLLWSPGHSGDRDPESCFRQWRFGDNLNGVALRRA